MDIRKIEKLIALVKKTGIGELELKTGEESIRISQASVLPAPVMTQPSAVSVSCPTPAVVEVPQAATQPMVVREEGHVVKSPMVGTVYLSATPGSKPFVEMGQRVSVGDTLCIIEAMKMFNKIEADKAGVLSARLVENEQPVEYDQALFVVTEG
ncbi:MAG: acetyl-CoA carboxylase, biotin carboxyl carrier protein [Gammaproteobacteria bacterium RIFCSPHIGHO2_12_FULL_45_9]|nr:MAG: acetyl-CoA carboxylase, biotin carboxyl carrier protein [Gammaproteobacteria bacterium RIFCSPHIGHO2_12_FULL_45_9]